MAKCLASTELSATLTLSQCTDGWWLYDQTRSMNLSMHAKTEREAFVEALTYYQERLLKVEKLHHDMKNKVDTFVCQFCEDTEE